MATQTPPPGPQVPLVIGVIGHRRLRPEDADVLRNALCNEFRAFANAYPHTPLVVLTALAQGADTLAAEAAKACDLKIRAAIPMPPEAYRASPSFGDDPQRQA